MNILLTWLTTIIISKVMNYITIGKIFKDIYGNGYKINFKKLNEMYNNYGNKSKIRQYIMLLNIFDSINIGMNYINNPNSVINFLNINDSLDEMSVDEKEIYDTKPSLLRVFYISELSDINEKKEINKNLEFKDTIKIMFEKRGKTSISLEYISDDDKIIVDMINIKTDTLFNVDDVNYNLFVMNELRSIKKVIKYPIRKERLIRYLKRLNKKERINIVEERINILDKNKILELNTKAVIYNDLTLSDIFYDKSFDFNEYVDFNLDKPIELKKKKEK